MPGQVTIKVSLRSWLILSASLRNSLHPRNYFPTREVDITRDKNISVIDFQYQIHSVKWQFRFMMRW